MTELKYDSGKSKPIFDRKWVILCEGEADKHFLHALIKARSLAPGCFRVYFPDRAGDATGGRSKMGKWLRNAYEGSADFRRNVQAVLIVSDNDSDIENSWAEVTTQIRSAGGYIVPAAERLVARSNSRPDIVVFMIPPGIPGNLETLCLEPIYEKWNIRKALDDFVALTPAANWTIGKQSKMRVQAALAATCRKRPDTSFVGHWQLPASYRIPVTHTVFDDLANFLSNFDALLAEPNE
jgi:hypothetical protein